ncbi:MAG: MFS transporter [Trebouxia sp. A1-2]|nr:MAG: MFS transporter [Trebouxia sp. A1-2]
MQLSQTHVLRVAAASRTLPSRTTSRVHVTSFRSVTSSNFRNRFVKLSSTNLHAISYAKPSRKHVQLTAASSAAAGDVAGQPSPDEAHASPAFQRTRFLAFAIMVTGYASYYLTRNSLNYVTPVMMQDKALTLTYTQIGGLTSILPVCYGASKFASGVLGARTSPTVLLAGGLIATALVNVAFGFGHAYLWFCVCWGANGLLQGLGAPACARFLTAWFAGKERGTFWGFWTASNNVGGFLAPLLETDDLS